MQHRMVDEAALWASTGEEMTQLQRLDERFRTLLKRAIRQRNAVMHGGETVPQVVARVSRSFAISAPSSSPRRLGPPLIVRT